MRQRRRSSGRGAVAKQARRGASVVRFAFSRFRGLRSVSGSVKAGRWRRAFPAAGRRRAPAEAARRRRRGCRHPASPTTARPGRCARAGRHRLRRDVRHRHALRRRKQRHIVIRVRDRDACRCIADGPGFTAPVGDGNAVPGSGVPASLGGMSGAWWPRVGTLPGRACSGFASGAGRASEAVGSPFVVGGVAGSTCVGAAPIAGISRGPGCGAPCSHAANSTLAAKVARTMSLLMPASVCESRAERRQRSDDAPRGSIAANMTDS